MSADPLEGSERARQASDTQTERCPQCPYSMEIHAEDGRCPIVEELPDRYKIVGHTPAAPETAPDEQFWKYHHDLLQRELNIARNLLGKCAGAMECLPCTPTYINLAKEARELLARAETPRKEEA